MAFSYSNSVTTENIFYTGTAIVRKNVAHYTLHMTLSETGTNVSTNKSTIAYKMWMTTTDWAFENLSIAATLEFTNVSNQTKTATYALQYPGYSGSSPTSITLLEGTVDVPHNSDGTLNVSFKGYTSNNQSYGGYPQNMTLSGTGALTAIPRTSTLSVSGSQTMGSSYTFTITRASSGLTHKILYSFGSTSGYVLGSASGASSSVSTSWAPPTSLASQSVVTGGQKSATITYTLYTYNGSTQIGTATATSTLSIPAADTLSSVTASQTMGTAYTFTCSQNASNYTHKLNWFFGNTSGTDSTAFTTSKSFTPSTSLGSQIPSSNSGTIYYSITTYNGSTVVGTSAQKSATLSIPSGAEPTFTFSASVTNGNSLGVAIVGYSTVAWSTTGVSAKYGATITSYSFSFAGVSSTDATKSGIKLVSGSAGGTSYTPTMTVTDSRGKKTTKTGTAVTVYTYAPPTITSSYAYRSDASGNRKDDGTYVARLINVKTDYSCGGKNTITCRSRAALAGESFGGYTTIGNNTRYVGSGWSIDQTHKVELSVIDSLGGHKEVVYVIPTANVAFNIREGGLGWGLGGYAPAGLLALTSGGSVKGETSQMRIQSRKDDTDQLAIALEKRNDDTLFLMYGASGRSGLYLMAADTNNHWVIAEEPNHTYVDIGKPVRLDGHTSHIGASHYAAKSATNSGTNKIIGITLERGVWTISYSAKCTSIANQIIQMTLYPANTQDWSVDYMSTSPTSSLGSTCVTKTINRAVNSDSETWNLFVYTSASMSIDTVIHAVRIQ